MASAISYPRPLRIVVRILVGIVLLVALLIFGLILLITTPFFAAKLGTILTHHSGRNIQLEGRIQMHLFAHEPRISITNIKVGNAEWSKNPTMFQADKIEVAIIPTELLKGRLALAELELDRPKLSLEKNLEGKSNWDFSQNSQGAVVKEAVPSSKSSFPIIHRLHIEDGELDYDDPKEHINTTLKVSSVNAKASDSIEIKGTGTYQQQPFKLDVAGDSVLQLRDSDQPYHFSLNTIIGNTKAKVEGTVQDPVKMEAVDVELHLQGTNAADLFPLTGIALPPTPPYDIKGHLVRTGIEWQFHNFAGRLGDSDLKGNILWNPVKPKPYFKGDFVSDNLDMKDLGGLVGANKAPSDPNRAIPDAPLDISRVMAMNADATFSGKHVKASDLLDNFYLDIHLRDGVLMVKPVSFSIGQGKIIANITINGEKSPPPVAMNLKLQRISLKDLFAPLAAKFGKENVSGGILGGQIELSGYGKSLRDMLATSNGTIGLGMEGGKFSHLLIDLIGLDVLRSAGLEVTGDNPVAVNCIVGDFGVNNGLAQTHELLIDTEASTIDGTGSINLRDETMALHFKVHPHEMSFLSAHSPLHINGTFKHPDAGVDVLPLAARGGVAALLGLLAPPAALLAFIQPGFDEDKGECVSLINRLHRDTGSKVPVNSHPVKK